MSELNRTEWVVRMIIPHEHILRKWLYRKCPNELSIDDVVQETYSKLVETPSIENIHNPRAYMFKVAQSIILSHIRRAQIVNITAVSDLSNINVINDDPSVEECMIWKQQSSLLYSILDSFPKSAKRAFLMRFEQNLSFSEIGRTLGISENAAQKNVARNLKILIKRLGEGGFSVSGSSSLNEDDRQGLKDDIDRPSKQY